MSQKFEILKEVRREYRRFNTVDMQFTVRLNPPPKPDTNPVDHFLASVNDLFECALQDVGEDNMAGIDIHNEINQKARPKVISFRRRDQLSGEVIWSVLRKW